MNQEETNISQELTPDEVASQQRLAEDMASQEQQVDICLEPDVCNACDDDKLAQAEALAKKNQDLYLRAVADLDTYKRKVQREKSELAKFAMQPLVEELLPSLDHLEMAIQAAKMVEGGENIAMGVEMVQSNIKKVFASFGIEEVAQAGGVFDPSKEDCVSQEASDVVPENSVIKVVRTGYIMNGRLLRPASVIVSSGKAK